MIQECDYLCSNGECIDEPITCSSDEECGEIVYKEKYCIENSVYQKLLKPKCLNPGEVNSECISENDLKFIEECDYLCSNGECIFESKEKLIINMGAYYENDGGEFNQRCGDKPPIVRVYLDYAPEKQKDYLNYKNFKGFIGEVIVNNKVLDKTNIWQITNDPNAGFNDKWQIYWNNFKDYEFDLKGIDLNQEHKIYVEYVNDCYGGGMSSSKENTNLYINKISLGDKEINLGQGESVVYNRINSMYDFSCVDRNADGINDCYDNREIIESCKSPAFHPTIRCGSFGWAGSIQFDFN